MLHKKDVIDQALLGQKNTLSTAMLWSEQIT